MEDETQPENTTETGRNPDGTWKKGFCPNPGGRGKSPLKDFSLKEFNSWDDEKKREYLNKMSPYDRWRMTEGNPAQGIEHSGEITEKRYVITRGEYNNRPLPGPDNPLASGDTE